MTNTFQAQSNTIITAVKLSRAQVRCLETMEQGPRPLPLTAIAETRRMNKLISFGLVDTRPTDRPGCPEYFLTLDGQETLRALNGQLPEIAAELPAKMPKTERKLIMSRDGYPLGILDVEVAEEGAIMDEDTNPIIETPARAINAFTAGQTVTYTSIHGKTYTGVVVSVLYDYDFPLMPRAKYEVRMNGNRHTTVYYPRELKAAVAQNTVDLYQAMKEAEQTYIHYMRMNTFDLPADHATYKRKVASHIAYLQAQAAFTGLSNDALITYLYGKNALQSRQKADSSPATASQVTASEMADTPAPLTQADGDAWLSRMRVRELSFAKQAAKQWGIAPSDAPRQPAPVTVKPPRAMTPAEQANHDALQAMIDASRSFGKAE